MLIIVLICLLQACNKAPEEVKLDELKAVTIRCDITEISKNDYTIDFVNESDKDIYFLKWNTPFDDGHASGLQVVQKSLLKKTIDPSKGRKHTFSNYIKIVAKGKVSTKVKLSDTHKTLNLEEKFFFSFNRYLTTASQVSAAMSSASVFAIPRPR